MPDVYPSRRIHWIEGSGFYFDWEIEVFYSSPVALMYYGVRNQANPRNPRPTLQENRLALAKDLHGELDETGVSHWNTDMDPVPWPPKDILEPGKFEDRICCGRVKKTAGSSSSPQP
jgi:hypothetical protein